MNSKKYNNIAIIIICFTIISGCATVESLKKVPDEKLKYNAGFYAENLYRQEFVRRHPEWADEIKQSILKGSARIGMTKDQARAAWGEPTKINRTVTQSGVFEQWVYNMVGKLSFLYFDNNKLTGIQN